MLMSFWKKMGMASGSIIAYFKIFREVFIQVSYGIEQPSFYK
jgi:hypothetical protein